MSLASRVLQMPMVLTKSRVLAPAGLVPREMLRLSQGVHAAFGNDFVQCVPPISGSENVILPEWPASASLATSPAAGRRGG